MLARQTNRLHLEFDLPAARRAFVEAGAADDLRGQHITSPHDLFSVETLRDAHGLRTGQPVPADVFVFGKGEPPRREGTQVGGLPYWPEDRPWPLNLFSGEPCLFLAQVNFADSRDLFPALPGEVLVLLVADTERNLWDPGVIHFEWLPLGLRPVARCDKSLIALRAGPFYGVIHRSADYPETLDSARRLKLRDGWNLPVLNGTKIGGVPHFIQSGDDSRGQFLCQLGSIQAAPDVPYPWVNQAEPLTLDFDDRGIHGRGNEVLFADLGSFYLFLRGDGTVTCSFESY